MGKGCGVPASHQSCGLGAAVPAGVLDVAQQHATVMPAAPGVVKHAVNVRVPLHLTASGYKRDIGTGEQAPC